jgi:FKBP-type peptidyl-prolyl cis-trans isomerase
VASQAAPAGLDNTLKRTQIKDEQRIMNPRNVADNQQFLVENAKQPNVQTTASGLQYKVLRAGSGAQCPPLAEVEVHYRGKLIDGTVFDSSYERNEPISFLLGQVIAGWQEGIPLMQVGGHYEFTIPHDLAYGPGGYPGVIPPSATLIFEVELLKVY